MWRPSLALLLACHTATHPQPTPRATSEGGNAPVDTSLEQRFGPALLAAIRSTESTEVIDWESIVESSMPEHIGRAP